MNELVYLKNNTSSPHSRNNQINNQNKKYTQKTN